MRTASLSFLLTLCSVPFARAANTGDNPTAVTQKLFDAMKAHDAAAATALFVPGATLSSVDASGKASVIPFEKFVEHLGTSKSTWLERMWNPQVLEHGSIAIVWAEYDFHLNGKFSHCGIDSFTLLKSDSGWKIAGISDTRETYGCTPSPLGLPHSNSRASRVHGLSLVGFRAGTRGIISGRVAVL
jgi:hypothetical protein